MYDRPSCIGCSFFDVSMLRMMTFRYDLIRIRFEGTCDLICNDTDYLLDDIRNLDIYGLAKANREYCDLSYSKSLHQGCYPKDEISSSER